MKKFQFKFDRLLKLRMNHRDLRRQLLADVLRHDEELVAERRRIEADRRRQLDELRRLGEGGNVDVDGAVARRSFAGQLTWDIGGVERQRALLAEQIKFCRQALIQADQAVKSLENLAEIQRTEFVFEAERREQREIEEGWRALHAGGYARC